MPLTPKGEKIKRKMEDEYGAEKGKQVFYASQNKGTIKGTHKQGADMSKFAEGFIERMTERGVSQDQAIALLKIAMFTQHVVDSPAFAEGAEAAIQKSGDIIGDRLNTAAGHFGLAKNDLADHAKGMFKGKPEDSILNPAASTVGDKFKSLGTSIKDTWNGMPGWGQAAAVGIPAAALGGLVYKALSKSRKPKEEVEDES